MIFFVVLPIPRENIIKNLQVNFAYFLSNLLKLYTLVVQLELSQWIGEYEVGVEDNLWTFNDIIFSKSFDEIHQPLKLLGQDGNMINHHYSSHWIFNWI